MVVPSRPPSSPRPGRVRRRRLVQAVLLWGLACWLFGLALAVRGNLGAAVVLFALGLPPALGLVALGLFV